MLYNVSQEEDKWYYQTIKYFIQQKIAEKANEEKVHIKIFQITYMLYTILYHTSNTTYVIQYAH